MLTNRSSYRQRTIKASAADQNSSIIQENGEHARVGQFSLNDFKNIINNENEYTSTRVVINKTEHKSSLGYSYSWNPLRLFWTTSAEKIENNEVATALKNALIHEYGEKTAALAFDLVDESTDWNACRMTQMIQKADEIAEPTIAPISRDDLERHSGARVIATGEIPDRDSSCKTMRVRLLKLACNEKEPYIRIEESLDETGAVTNRARMLGNYICIALTLRGDPEYNVEPEELEKNLQSKISGMEIKVQKCNFFDRSSGLVFFKPTPLDTFSKVIEETRELGVVCYPNFTGFAYH